MVVSNHSFIYNEMKCSRGNLFKQRLVGLNPGSHLGVFGMFETYRELNGE